MAANMTAFQLFQQGEATDARRKLILKMVDATDGFTEETGLTFAAADVKISKNGAAFVNTTNSPSEVAFGSYVLELTVTELNTIGVIEIRAIDAAARNFYAFGQVIGFDLWDGTPNVGTAQSVSGDIAGDINGQVTAFSAGAKTEIENAIWDALPTAHSTVNTFGLRLGALLSEDSEVNDAGATATDFDTNLSEAVDDFWNDSIIVFIQGALLGQSRRISDYDGTAKNITVSPAFTSAPANGNSFVILSGVSEAGLALTDTLTELAQAKPDAVPTIDKCLMLLYMMARNKIETSGAEQKIHNDAGVVIAKAATEFAAGVFKREELESGP